MPQTAKATPVARIVLIGIFTVAMLFFLLGALGILSIPGLAGTEGAEPPSYSLAFSSYHQVPPDARPPPPGW